MKENGEELPTIKKQRDSAVNNQSPPLSFQSLSPESQKIKEEEQGGTLPIIPTFKFLGSNRSLPSAFTPYLQEPLYQQLHDNVYLELAGKKPDSKVSLEAEIEKKDP